MKIAVDFDGVLLDLMGRFCEIFNERFNTNYKKSDVVQWEFYLDWGISKECCYDIFFELCDNMNSISLIDEDAPEIMGILNYEHNVDILSAKKPEYKKNVIEKLDSLNIKQGVQYDNLIIVEYFPYDIKLQYNFNIFVDDNPYLIEKIKEMRDKILLLYDQPWNQNFNCGQNVLRIYSWKQIYDTIKDLVKEI